MRTFDDGRMARRVEFIESAGRSIGRSGEFATSGCVVEAGMEFNDRGLVPAVSIMAVTSKGKIGSAEVMVHCEAAGEIGAFLIEAFCRQATAAAREALLGRLKTICAGEPDPERVQPVAGFQP